MRQEARPETVLCGGNHEPAWQEFGLLAKCQGPSSHNEFQGPKSRRSLDLALRSLAQFATAAARHSCVKALGRARALRGYRNRSVGLKAFAKHALLAAVEYKHGLIGRNAFKRVGDDSSGQACLHSFPGYRVAEGAKMSAALRRLGARWNKERKTHHCDAMSQRAGPLPPGRVFSR